MVHMIMGFLETIFTPLMCCSHTVLH